MKQAVSMAMVPVAAALIATAGCRDTTTESSIFDSGDSARIVDMGNIMHKAATANRKLGEKVPRGKTAAPPPSKQLGGVNWRNVYEYAAPSVVFVIANDGTGTGFLVSTNGWLLTNHHVVENGARTLDGHRVVTIEVGTIDSETGFMKRSDIQTVAVVHKWDQIADLAALKIDTSTEVGRRIARRRGLPIAREGRIPAPGQDVALIGNAGVDFMWSIKVGSVMGVGDLKDVCDVQVEVDMMAAYIKACWPQEELNDEDMRLMYLQQAGPMAETFVIEASAESAHGDSGGPLLDEDGQVVGIAVMGYGGDARTRSYYIHHKEIIEFAGSVSDTPLLDIPVNAWSPSVVYWNYNDVEDDGTPELLVGFDEDDNLCAFGLDVDHDSSPAEFMTTMDIGGEEAVVVDDNLVNAQKGTVFDAEFAVVIDYIAGYVFALYDTDNDGRFDRIRVSGDGDPIADSEFVFLPASDTYEHVSNPTGDWMLTAEDLAGILDPAELALYGSVRRQLTDRLWPPGE